MDTLKSLENLMKDSLRYTNNIPNLQSQIQTIQTDIQNLQQNIATVQTTLASVVGNTTPSPKPKEKRVYCCPTTWKQVKASFINPTWKVATVFTFLLSLLGFTVDQSQDKPTNRPAHKHTQTIQPPSQLHQSYHQSYHQVSQLRKFNRRSKPAK